MRQLNLSACKMSQSVRWAFNIKEWNPNANEFSHAISCVQPEEKDRLGRFVFRRDVKASLTGRLLMRKFINEYAHIPYNEIRLGRNEQNKPVLRGAPGRVSFNVSHQGDYSVLAGETEDIKLGVDIMKLEYTGGKELSEFFRLMTRNFSAAEWKEIKEQSTSEFEQIAMFMRHWALKESYVKALGIGIVVDLEQIDFRTNSKLNDQLITTDTDLYVNGVRQNWLFEESLLNNHVIAVALQGDQAGDLNTEKNSFRIINADELFTHSVPLLAPDATYTEEYFKKEERPKF